MQPSKWQCKKCKNWLGTNIDQDYHENTVHPDLSNPFVASWWRRGCPGMSPYD